ncbi:MAG: hypothetical protein AB1546_07855 [bacterium]
MGILERILNLKLARAVKSEKEIHSESLQNREAIKRAAREEAMKRLHYDIKAINDALLKAESGEILEKVIAELNSDPTLLKPVDIEMFNRLLENRRMQSSG